MKNYALLLSVFCLISCNQSNKSIIENEILWDTYGIPHIYATSDNDLYFMSAWGQMKNHGNLILKLYGEARGTSAEMWGEGFEINKALHHLGLYEQLKPAYDNLTPKYQEMLQNKGMGSSAQPNISSSDIESIEFNIPSNRIIQKFGDLVKPLFDKIIQNLYENDILENIRDTLLPKLISGKIRVKTGG